MSDAIVLITGMPRAGTTLTAELLGQLPDCVSLDEPIDGDRLVRGAQQPAGRWVTIRSRVVSKAPPAKKLDPERVADNVLSFCRDMRRSALDRGVVVSKHVAGSVEGSKWVDPAQPGGQRKRLARREEIQIAKRLSPDFTLFVKHCSTFVGILPQLSRRAPVYATVRNPLSILASWNTMPFPVRQGHAHAAERFDACLARTLARIPDVYTRQIHLLQWFFARLHDVLGISRIVRYEDVISSGGSVLQVIHPSAADTTTPLASRNRNKVYDGRTMTELGRRLLDTDGAFWKLYDRADVVGLIPT